MYARLEQDMDAISKQREGCARRLGRATAHRIAYSAPTMVKPRGVGPPKFTKLPTPLLNMSKSIL